MQHQQQRGKKQQLTMRSQQSSNRLLDELCLCTQPVWSLFG